MSKSHKIYANHQKFIQVFGQFVTSGICVSNFELKTFDPRKSILYLIILIHRIIGASNVSTVRQSSSAFATRYNQKAANH